MIWLLAGCGALFGPPVTCTVEALSIERAPHTMGDVWARDLVCHADEELEDYWVILEGEDEWGDFKSGVYGHHGVHKGDLDHHEARVGMVVTIEADGYWSRRFTIR